MTNPKDGRIARDDETLASINPNTWDSVTRIYLCRKEISSTQTRSRCKLIVNNSTDCIAHVTYTGASFTRDFLEMEQNRRSDINFAYDITEFTSKL